MFESVTPGLDQAELPALLPAGLARRLPTLGHGLAKVREGWSLLRTRLQRGLLDEANTAWVKEWAGPALDRELRLPFDEPQQALVCWHERRWQVISVLGGVAAAEGGGDWLTALMALRLPILRDFWRHALRSQRYAWMTQVLPSVWPLDARPLRPGAVIAGLSIAKWSDLSRVMAAGRSFSIVDEAGQEEPLREDALSSVLESLSGHGRLLVKELPATQPDGRLLARWKLEEGRMTLDSVRLLSAD